MQIDWHNSSKWCMQFACYESSVHFLAFTTHSHLLSLALSSAQFSIFLRPMSISTILLQRCPLSTHHSNAFKSLPNNRINPNIEIHTHTHCYFVDDRKLAAFALRLCRLPFGEIYHTWKMMVDWNSLLTEHRWKVTCDCRWKNSLQKVWKNYFITWTSELRKRIGWSGAILPRYTFVSTLL